MSNLFTRCSRLPLNRQWFTLLSLTGLLLLLSLGASAQISFSDFGVPAATAGSVTLTATTSSLVQTTFTASSANVTIGTSTYNSGTGTTTATASFSVAGNYTITAAASGLTSVVQGLLVPSTATPTTPYITAAAGVPSTLATSATLTGFRPTYSPLYSPNGVAADANGNLYFGDNVSASSGRIYRIDASTGNLSLLAGGGATAISATPVAGTSASLGAVRGLAVDGNRLYVANYSTKRIELIDLSAGTIVAFTPLLTTVNTSSQPWGVAVDGSGGDLYITDVGAGLLLRANYNTGALTTAATLPASSSPRGLARASNGDFYIGGNSTNAIYKYTPSTSTLSAAIAITGTALTGANSLAFDYNGVLYVGGNVRVYRVVLTTNNGTTTGVSSAYAGNNTAFNASTNPAPTNNSAATAGAVTPSGLLVLGNRLLVASASAYTLESVTDANLQQTQTITFPDFGLKTVGDPSFTLTATATSGLPVTYTSSNTAVATVSGNTVTIVGAGNALITASQAGNAAYQAAPSVPQGLLVAAATAATLPINALAGVPGTQAAAVPLTGFRATYSPLYNPYGVVADANGNFYFADNVNANSGPGRVYRIDASTGQLSLIAGGGATAISATAVAATSATIGAVRGLAIDGNRLYVANYSTKRIELIDLGAGTIVAFTPLLTTVNASSQPWGVAVDGSGGDLYITDVGAGQLLRASYSTGALTTAATGLSSPRGIARASNGDFYIGDNTTNALYKYTPSTNTLSAAIALTGTALSGANSLAFDYNGVLYVGGNARVYRVVLTTNNGTTTGVSSAYAGNNNAFNASTNPAPANNTAATSGALIPSGLVVYANRLLVASAGTYSVEAITDANLQVAQNIISFADFGLKTAGDPSFTVTATASSGLPVTFTSSNTAVATVSGTTVTIVGPGNALIIASQAGNTSTQAAPSRSQGLLVSNNPPASVPLNALAGVPGVQATGEFPVNGTRATYTALYGPQGVVTDASNNTYFVDNVNATAGPGRIYRVDGTSGAISLVAGGGAVAVPAAGGAPIDATTAALGALRGLALDGTNLYVANYSTRRVQVVSLAAATPTIVDLTASFGNTNRPWALAVDGAGGDIYATDVDGNQLVRVSAATGALTTVATLPNPGTTPSPRGLARAANGDFYVGDNANSLLYKYTPSTNTLSAIALTGTALSGANSLAFATNGNLFVGGNNRIYRVVLTTDGSGTTTGDASVYAGGGSGAPANGVSLTGGPVAPSGLFIRGTRLYVSGAGTYGVRVVNDPNGPLPVELVAFTAERRGSDALLRWTTASEKSNAGFEVQVSADGKEFTKVGWVAGRGSSATANQYSFTDAGLTKVAGPVAYYRLRQVDFDGTATFSPVRTVQAGGSAEGMSLYPNPAHGSFRVTGLTTGQVVQVLDNLGRTVITTTVVESDHLDVALPDSLPAGIYVVRSGSSAQRLTVE